MGQTPKAIETLKNALNEADDTKEHLEADDKQEVVVLMELFVENLNLYTNF